MKKLYFFLFSIIVVENSSAQNFIKITNGPAVNTPSDSRSVNWVDINNDGKQDLMITNGLNTGQNNFLYINMGNDNFAPIDSTQSIVNDMSPSDGATWADIDNDGDLDCFVATWYNKKNLLYLNNGNGTFTQIKTGTIVNEFCYSETASWGDYDNDGKLDIYITNSEGAKRNFLYKGNGDSTFTKITNVSTTETFKSRTVNWIDVDDDRDLDLFVTNEGNQKVNLYRNDSNGVFTKTITGVLPNISGETMSSSWEDVDNDGDLDVFLSNYDAPNRLLKKENLGDYVIDTLWSNTTPYTFGSTFGDIDNDGDLDLFLSNAFGPGKLKNFLYMNNGEGVFTQNDTSILTVDSGWTYGCAFADYNNDGFLDLATANCFNKTQVNSIYRNIPNGNAWFELDCIGTVSNRSAIGAKIKLKAIIHNKQVTQQRIISSVSGHNGQNMLRAHFGLGDATIIQELSIEWPSGIKDVYQNARVDTIMKAFENVSLGINTHQKKRDLKVYPNPAHTTLFVTRSSHFVPRNEYQIAGSKYPVEILDLLGRIVLHTEIIDGKIDIRALRDGVYLVRVDEEVARVVIGSW